MPKLTEFQTTDKLTLPGLLYSPSKKINKVAVNLHGCGSTSIFYSAQRQNTLAKHLNKAGISFFTFNNRGANLVKSLKRNKGTDEEEKVYLGTSYELIKECVYDIDGAIDYLKTLGYRTFYLIGHSTGANKICVYNWHKLKNPISKYILLGGGDDSGIYYKELGAKKFKLALKRCKEMIKKGKGEEFVPKYILNFIYSYQALYDIINPDGDYNCFPFTEYIEKIKLSKKQPLFQKFKSLNRPTLVVYGSEDEYCLQGVSNCIQTLKKNSNRKLEIEYRQIAEADHGFSGKEEGLGRIISSWLQ